MAEIPAYYMRGGTSKGMFFLADDLPKDAETRDALLLRVIGSPDPYARHADGMGGATASTSKVALVRAARREGCDIEFLFGAVSVDAAHIDWTAKCGDLLAAAGPFAIWRGFVPARDGAATVRIWHANAGQTIHSHVPCRNGHPVESGEFSEDGVPFPCAEIVLAYQDPPEVVHHSARRLMTGIVHVPERC